MDPATQYAAAKETGAIADLSNRCKFQLTGADCLRYLNGQVSADVRKLSPREAVYGCVMTAKGKMCADIWITAGQATLENEQRDFFRVDAEPMLRESLGSRLERYIIADDVTLRDTSDEETLLHVIGADFGNFSDLKNLTPNRSTRFGRPGLDFFAPRESSDKLRAQLNSKLPTIDEQVLEILRIEAGIPRWGCELDENTIPVEAGLDKTAIDYDKGCYIGQEVISRIKSIGHVNRHLRGLISRDGSPLRRGMQLLTNDGQDAGRVTSAAYSFGLEKEIALGYVKRIATGAVLNVRGDEKEHALDVVELPFI